MKKSILFGGPAPSPPRGGRGWGHFKNEKSRLSLSSVKLILFFGGGGDFVVKKAHCTAVGSWETGYKGVHFFS
jgi:hypothetical protein